MRYRLCSSTVHPLSLQIVKAERSGVEKNTSLLLCFCISHYKLPIIGLCLEIFAFFSQKQGSPHNGLCKGQSSGLRHGHWPGNFDVASRRFG